MNINIKHMKNDIEFGNSNQTKPNLTNQPAVNMIVDVGWWSWSKEAL